MKIKIKTKHESGRWILGEVEEDNEIVDMLKSLPGKEFKLEILEGG